MALIIVLWIIINIVSICTPQINNGYNCSPSSCQGSCTCASSKAPVTNPPQFIVLTEDDAVTSLAASTMMSVLSGLVNPNGCALPATWYVTIANSVPEMVNHLFNSNHEIADHTVNHPPLPSSPEISDAREWLASKADVVASEIRGFRAPFLRHDVAQRKQLFALGFKYDSSITQQPTTTQLFPYTLDHGVAIDCSVGTGTCSASESYPGMWSVPMWTLPNALPMDISNDVYAQYTSELNVKYNGNRSPLGIFVHAGWVSQKACALRQFLSDALAAHDDIWVVTNWQLIEWMMDPVDAPTYRQRMTQQAFCPRRPVGPMPPVSGCLFGSWDRFSYRCICQNEMDPNANGYCRSSDGSCQTAKQFINGAWACGGVVNPASTTLAACLPPLETIDPNRRRYTTTTTTETTINNNNNNNNHPSTEKMAPTKVPTMPTIPMWPWTLPIHGTNMTHTPIPTTMETNSSPSMTSITNAIVAISATIVMIFA